MLLGPFLDNSLISANNPTDFNALNNFYDYSMPHPSAALGSRILAIPAPVPHGTANSVLAAGNIDDEYDLGNLRGPNETIKSKSGRAYRYKCTVCEDKFTSKKDLDRHWRSKHDTSTPYVCTAPGCRRSGKGFSRKDNYVTHLRSVHGIVPGKELPGGGLTDIALVMRAQQESTGDTRDKCGLEQCSKEELIAMVLSGRNEIAIQRQRRKEAEDELKCLRHKFEEWQDI